MIKKEPIKSNKTKECKRCQTIFPATPYFFYRDKESKDKLRKYCKNCYKAHLKFLKTRKKERIINTGQFLQHIKENHPTLHHSLKSKQPHLFNKQ